MCLLFAHHVVERTLFGTGGSAYVNMAGCPLGPSLKPSLSGDEWLNSGGVAKGPPDSLLFRRVL